MVYFDEQSGDCYSAIYWKCVDDAGTLLFDEQLSSLYCADAGLRTLSLGRTYTITVYGQNGATGTYQFQVWNVPAPQQFSISIGRSEERRVGKDGDGNIETPGEREV